MNTADICIIKRDGKREDFSASKISNAIGKAFQATGLERQEALIDEMIADAWYMVSEYHLNLGPNDALERVVHRLSEISHMKSSEENMSRSRSPGRR